MSVLIKGIELPERVQVLELHHDGKVFTRKGYLVGEAVELPDKHGRLGDLDALEPDADYDDGDYWAYSVAQVCNAPTIVEAEGEND